jgi:hypothetical protein
MQYFKARISIFFIFSNSSKIILIDDKRSKNELNHAKR